MTFDIFSATVTSEPDRNLLVLAGEIDRAAEPRLRALHQLLARDPRPIVLECSGVTFMDAGGLRFLLGALERGPQDRLANIPSSVARLLRIVGRHDVVASGTTEVPSAPLRPGLVGVDR